MLILVFCLGGAGCSDAGKTTEADRGGPLEVGIASYYADRFDGNLTSTEERYDQQALTAASKKYPYNTVLEVTNLTNDASVRVRVNDCGPHHPNRIIDLSKAAASKIGMEKKGTARVSLKVLELGTDGPTCNR